MAPNLEEFREAADQFSLKIYQNIIQDKENAEKNAFLSPLSIQSALLLAYLGADGSTKQEMANTLHLEKAFGGNEQQLLDVYGEVLRVFVPSKNDDGVENYHLALANKAYLRKGLHVKADFKATIKDKLKSEVGETDFENNPAGAVAEINQWVEKQTHNKIRDLVSTQTVTPDTAFVLVNAIYFKAQWHKEFEEHATYKDADFTNLNGQTSKVDLMHKSLQAGYTETEHFQLLRLPYKNHELSMIIVLPKKRNGLKELEGQLSVRMLRDAVEKASEREVDVYLPKFKLEQSYELVPVLQSLGVRQLFEEADLSRMVENERLAVSNVIHKAFVEVNEAGTEAAAATAVIGIMKCSFEERLEPPPTFRADHPFLFAIRHEATQLLTFMGRVGSL
ncbi:leukocyte elastase inhibitor-like isoform X4 [Paramacrobiotus metropolitanus]|uniref:leukocyte elastase inhibitor-like isoform X4 n=1 Tax=Paramacrobiotus metropolitanus TaxID=2943436 RepID=UPI002445E957|nr:leukocyte elastase inhibitor-like isoform X4 [Paramacrobiotus metropolitanus]